MQICRPQVQIMIMVMPMVVIMMTVIVIRKKWKQSPLQQMSVRTPR